MKEYVIISEPEMTIVENKVSKMLNEGWKLAGGVCVAYKHEHPAFGEHAHIPGHLVFSQALEREN